MGKKTHQRFYFLGRLRKFGMTPTMLTNLYGCTIVSKQLGYITAFLEQLCPIMQEIPERCGVPEVQKKFQRLNRFPFVLQISATLMWTLPVLRFSVALILISVYTEFRSIVGTLFMFRTCMRSSNRQKTSCMQSNLRRMLQSPSWLS